MEDFLKYLQNLGKIGGQISSKNVWNSSRVMNKNKKIVTPEKVVWHRGKGNTVCGTAQHLCWKEQRMRGKS